jgi:hypothetical protein
MMNAYRHWPNDALPEATDRFAAIYQKAKKGHGQTYLGRNSTTQNHKVT